MCHHCSLFFYLIRLLPPLSFFFFFNDTATTEIYTLSLHDALPILEVILRGDVDGLADHVDVGWIAVELLGAGEDRKSTRLNSSHLVISYAVFCLKKKKKCINTVHTLHIPHIYCICTASWSTITLST